MASIAHGGQDAEMANYLKMADVQAIQALRARGWSYRRIGRELDIHRETVKRYVDQGQAGQNRPNLPPGSDDENRPNPPPGPPVPNQPDPPNRNSGPSSQCEPFRDTIIAGLERGLSRQRIWQDLCEDGFAGAYDSVKRYAGRLAAANPLPFRRMECAPGAEAQVDFGQGAPVIQADGKRKRPHAFRIVLSHSRKAYSEVVWRQSTEEFIRCLENAFWHFGGVPQTLVIDNLKAAVIKADWYDPDLNPKLRDFARHYGTVVLPTKPRTPRHKGKVEAGVKYVQSNALKGRSFESLADQNRHLLEWEAKVADTRIHGTTQKQVGKCFEEAERPTLLPLPADRFPSFQEGKRIVNRDGHVEVAKAYYSLPPEYLGRTVWVRWESRIVRIFDENMRQIAEHVRKEPGKFGTNDQHVSARKISGIERGAAYILNKVSSIGPKSAQWGEAMLARRGIEGVRVLQGLLSMTHRHKADSIEKACEIAHGHAAYRLRDVRELIGRQASTQEQFEFAEEHEIIRSLSEYEALVHSAFTKESL